jgi:hypothetical protein
VLICNARRISGTFLLQCCEEFALEAIYSEASLLAPIVILLCDIERQVGKGNMVNPPVIQTTPAATMLWPALWECPVKHLQKNNLFTLKVRGGIWRYPTKSGDGLFIDWHDGLDSVE